jgi:hypothetical protein
MSYLTSENYRKGFLIDDEWIGGITVSETPTAQAGGVDTQPSGTGATATDLGATTTSAAAAPTPAVQRRYHAYCANYRTTETVFSRTFDSLQPALDFMNKQERYWIYEAIGCGHKTTSDVGSNSSASTLAPSPNTGGGSCGTKSCC